MMPSVIPATAEHILPVARELRPADAAEVLASDGCDPFTAVAGAFEVSTLAWAALDDDGTPMAMFGVAPMPGHPDLGSPWLLATPALEKHRREFLARSREFVEKMAEKYPVMFNYVDVRNRASVRWLQWCGFRLAAFVPEHGVARIPFYLFTYIRGSNV